MKLNRREFLKAIGILGGGVFAWKSGVFEATDYSLDSLSTEAATVPTVKGAHLTLGTDQLLASDDTTQTPTGISAAAAGGHNGPFTSGVIAAPLPFSHAGIRYIGDMPRGTSVAWEARGSLDGQNWTRWHVLTDQVDLRFNVEGQAATNLFSLDEDGIANLWRFLQVRTRLGRATNGEMPSLSSITIAFIDPTGGPAISQTGGTGMISAESVDQSIVQASNRIYFPLVYKQPPPTPTKTPTRVPTSTPTPSVPKPSVIARTGWGCPDGESSPNWPPDYRSVSALIVHHTDTPNSAPNGWDAWVRSIWYYHADTLAWGDIGYNYLIDPNGKIYEGRAGGDNVVGGHALQYNWGSLGVAFLGTYGAVLNGTYIDAYPSAAAQASLVNLLAWKAWQQGINLLLLSKYFVDKYLPTLMGHRDCLATTCPGDDAYSLLPQIRQSVSAKASGH